MATISISGTNKLAERIVADAQAEAKATLDESGAAVRAILAESEKAVAQQRAELSAKREGERASILGGYRTRAALDGRKSALAKKRDVIDRAFTGAYQAMLAQARGRFHLKPMPEQGARRACAAAARRRFRPRWRAPASSARTARSSRPGGR